MAQTKPFSQVSPPMTTQPNSSLLSLPPEIRNDIYERVFDYMVFDARSLSYGPRNFTAKNLLLTCKQIHTEAIKVFYSTTTFHFVPHESIPFRSWICKFGPARVSLMKDVRCDRLFEGHDRYDDIDLEGDEAVLWNARRAQKYIDRQKDDFSLHEGFWSNPYISDESDVGYPNQLKI
ncbi:hypothetical protein MMC10_010149 [Thelotrema lepadinum]|nr:hypothetical protein [Thelotrema lepadinum]